MPVEGDAKTASSLGGVTGADGPTKTQPSGVDHALSLDTNTNSHHHKLALHPNEVVLPPPPTLAALIHVLESHSRLIHRQIFSQKAESGNQRDRLTEDIASGVLDPDGNGLFGFHGDVHSTTVNREDDHQKT